MKLFMRTLNAAGNNLAELFKKKLNFSKFSFVLATFEYFVVL